MAKGIRSLLDTVGEALPQVGNLGSLFFLLFFIFAALGVELFGKLGKSYDLCVSSIIHANIITSRILHSRNSRIFSQNKRASCVPVKITYFI